MNEEKSLIEIKNKKIWDKIIYFFTHIFKNKKNIDNIDNKTYVGNIKNTNEIKDNFLKEITVKEDSRLLNIQNCLENGEILISSLSKEQIKDINNLYERQIKVLNENYKRQIVELRLLQKQLSN